MQRPEEIPSFDIVLFLLPSILTRSSDDAIKTIYDLIYTLASHVRPLFSSHSQNVRPQDLKTMLLPFRLGTFTSEEDETKEGLFQSADYLATLLRIAQAPRAPPSFFSWTEPSSGVTAYPTVAWSKSGYTLFCWVRIENFASGGSLLPL